MRVPPAGIEPASPARKADVLTTTPWGRSLDASRRLQRTHQPAVDGERLAGDVGGALGAQEGGGGAQLLRRPEAGRGHLVARAGRRLVEASVERGRSVRADSAGQQAVERDAVGGDGTRDRLERGDRGRPVAVGEHEVADRLPPALPRGGEDGPPTPLP